MQYLWCRGMKTGIYDTHFSIKLPQTLRAVLILPKLWLDGIQVLFLSVSEPASGGVQGSDELFSIQTICLANR